MVSSQEIKIMTMEKLGVSQEQLKEELTKELSELMNKKNQLVKTGGLALDAGVEAGLDAAIAGVKSQMDKLV
jgi:hypothetical protein